MIARNSHVIIQNEVRLRQAKKPIINPTVAIPDHSPIRRKNTPLPQQLHCKNNKPSFVALSFPEIQALHLGNPFAIHEKNQTSATVSALA